VNDSPEPQQISAHGRERPLVYEWVGELVFLQHLSGPAIPEDIRTFGRGQLEARTGIYLLREVSALGVVVRHFTTPEGREDDFDLGPSRFIPWSAIQSIQGVPKDENEKEILKKHRKS
jgi:hypothetical protein